MHQNSILFMILKIWLLCDISELSGNLLSTNAKWFSGREDTILDVIFTFTAFLLLLLLSFTVKYFFLFSSTNAEYRKETFFVIPPKVFRGKWVSRPSLEWKSSLWENYCCKGEMFQNSKVLFY